MSDALPMEHCQCPHCGDVARRGALARIGECLHCGRSYQADQFRAFDAVDRSSPPQPGRIDLRITFSGETAARLLQRAKTERRKISDMARLLVEDGLRPGTWQRMGENSGAAAGGGR